MISKKELAYVGNYARRAPFPGREYAIEVLNELNKSYEEYKKKYMNKNYSLIFSNGEEIEFEISSKNLAHLLGIDFKNLSSEYMENTCKNVLGLKPTDKKDSYSVLTRIIERSDEVLKNDSSPENNRILNYYKVMIKCISFSKLTEFDKFNYGCINFENSIYKEQTSNETSLSSDKLLFTPSNEAITPYFMMGINKSEENGVYYPETIIAPLNYSDFFKKQTLLLPIQILISDENELAKIVATPEEKIALLNMYKTIITENNTGSHIDIFNDYQNILRERKRI